VKEQEERPGHRLADQGRVPAKAKAVQSLYLNHNYSTADRKRKLDELGLQPSRDLSDILEGIKQLLSEEARAKAAGRHEDAREARRGMLHLQCQLLDILDTERKAGAAS